MAKPERVPGGTKGVPQGVLQMDTFEAVLNEAAALEISKSVQAIWDELMTLTKDAQTQAGTAY